MHDVTTLEGGWRTAGIVALGAVVLVVALALVSGETSAAALLLFVPVLPVAALVGLKGLAGHRVEAMLLAWFVVFVCAANFRVRDYADKSLDFQVLLKLSAIGICVAVCTVHVRALLGRLNAGLGLWAAYFAILVGSSAYAVQPSFAAMTSISFVVAFAYVLYLAISLGRQRTVEVMVAVVLVMSVASLAVYWAVPSLGRMQAWTGVEFGTIGRLRGITGSANAIGSTAAFGILLAVLYFRDFRGGARLMAVVTIVAAAACVHLSDNRMSILAFLCAVWFWFAFGANAPARLLLSVCLAVVGVLVLAVFADAIFASLSRTGNAAEITSATGRSEIWSVAIELWSQRPLLGWGYASALSILPGDPRLFGVAAHTHNLYLETLFSTGLVGFGMFLSAVAATLWRGFAVGAVREMALIVFFLVRGMTEASPLSGMAGFATFAFSLGIVLVLTSPRRAPRPAAAGLPSRWPGTSASAPDPRPAAARG